jgi:GAF domain-containing protein
MLERFTKELRTCPDMQSALDCLLHRSLEISHTQLGNVQLVDRTSGSLVLEAHNSFHEEFLRFFARVRATEGSACARALRDTSPIVIEDVSSDEQFAPYREIAYRAGFRAVVSVPLVSTIGTVVGVLSTHFPMRHKPSDIQLSALLELGRLATNAIILRRARARAIGDPRTDSAADVAETLKAISESDRWIHKADISLKKSDELLHESQLAILRSKRLLRENVTARR